MPDVLSRRATPRFEIQGSQSAADICFGGERQRFINMGQHRLCLWTACATACTTSRKPSARRSTWAVAPYNKTFRPSAWLLADRPGVQFMLAEMRQPALYRAD